MKLTSSNGRLSCIGCLLVLPWLFLLVLLAGCPAGVGNGNNNGNGNGNENGIREKLDKTVRVPFTADVYDFLKVHDPNLYQLLPVEEQVFRKVGVDQNSCDSAPRDREKHREEFFAANASEPAPPREHMMKNLR